MRQFLSVIYCTVFATFIIIIMATACSGLTVSDYELSSDCPVPVIESSPAPTIAPMPEATPSPASEPPPRPTGQAETWQEAYAKLLRWYMVYAPPIDDGLIRRSFILHDLDLDGIPELIVTYIAAGIWTQSINTFRDSRTVQLEGSFFAYFSVYVPLNDKPGIVIQAYGHTCLMVVDEYSLVCSICLDRPFFPADWYGATVNWYINGEVVTEEEHDSIFHSLVAYDHEERGRRRLWPYDITEDKIQSIIFNWEP